MILIILMTQLENKWNHLMIIKSILLLKMNWMIMSMGTMKMMKIFLKDSKIKMIQINHNMSEESEDDSEI